MAKKTYSSPYFELYPCGKGKTISWFHFCKRFSWESCCWWLPMRRDFRPWCYRAPHRLHRRECWLVHRCKCSIWTHRTSSIRCLNISIVNLYRPQTETTVIVEHLYIKWTWNLLHPANAPFSTIEDEPLPVRSSMKPGNFSIFWANSFVELACK